MTDVHCRFLEAGCNVVNNAIVDVVWSKIISFICAHRESAAVDHREW